MKNGVAEHWGPSPTRRNRSRQLLDDGRHRPLRPLLGDSLLPRQRARGVPLRRGAAHRRLGWTEIWNLVFTQYDHAANDAPATPLPAPSIDTGMGLERITAALQGVTSNYDTDLLRVLVDRAAQNSGKVCIGGPGRDDVDMRVLADHARTTASLIAEDVLPERSKLLVRVQAERRAAGAASDARHVPLRVRRRRARIDLALASFIAAHEAAGLDSPSDSTGIWADRAAFHS